LGLAIFWQPLCLCHRPPPPEHSSAAVAASGHRRRICCRHRYHRRRATRCRRCRCCPRVAAAAAATSTNARKYSGFAFYSTGRKCSAAQVPPIHPPHHRAGYAPVRPFCTTEEHARRSSWLHNHHRLQAFLAVNGYTVGGRYPSTRPPKGRYHSTDSGRPKAMCQRHSFACPVLPRRVCPGRGGREGSAHPGADPFEPPRLLRWRTYDEPSGQTEWQGPQGKLSGDRLPQERHSSAAAAASCHRRYHHYRAVRCCHPPSPPLCSCCCRRLSHVLRCRLVLILAGALFYGTVSFQKILVSEYTVP